MAIFLFLVVHWYLSVFSQTFFLHRYGAHQMFSMSPFWQRFFHVFTFVTQGPSYLNPRAYALLHRLHHAHSDTEKDPHSPLFYKTPFGMMKNTLHEFIDIQRGKKFLGPEVAGEYPSWPALDWFFDGYLGRGLMVVLYVLFYAHFATAWWMWLFLPIHILMGPIHGAVVNWCGHKYGYANFDNGDASKNTFFMDLVTIGELMQNNHHRHGLRANFAVRWFEFDPTYAIIRLFDRLGIVRLVKDVS